MAPLIERSPWDSSVRCHQPQPWPQSPALHFQCPREGGRASRALRGGSRDVTCTEVCPRSSPRTRQTAQSTWQVFVPFHLEPPRPVCRRADEKQYPPLSAPRAGQALQHSQLSIKLRLEAHGWKGWKGRQEASNPNQANNFAGVSNLRESENKAIQVRHWSGKGGGEKPHKEHFSGWQGGEWGWWHIHRSPGRQLQNSPIQRGQTSVTTKTAQGQTDNNFPYQGGFDWGCRRTIYHQWKEVAILSCFPSKGKKREKKNLFSSVWINFPVSTE